ncbi:MULTISPECIES: tetratricopeptide repeat protein [unclassified Carboxylicivirga]|uniref:tetratricopeptide repeat protein n=1 Tax=Carboxylicivirga TaxID=1628153 RepID=UPI003D350949
MGKKYLRTTFLIAATVLAGLLSSVNAQGRVDSLIQRGQFLSAFECLKHCDDQPDCVLKKVDLALNYHLTSHYHQRFSFVNLRSGESLDQLRRQEPLLPATIIFQVDSVLLKMQQLHPADFRITKALGDFYTRVYHDFGDRWGEGSEVLLEKSNHYYRKAFENGVYDFYSLYSLGYYQSILQNYYAAQQWFLMSLDRKPDEALTNYSLAVTYLFDGLPQKGIEYAVRAYELYADSLERSDAARISGVLYLKTKQPERAECYFEYANRLQPNYRPNELYLLNAKLKLNKDSVSGVLAYDLLLGAPYTPTLPDELNSIFVSVGKPDLLLTVYKQVLVACADDAEACGNLYFHYGKLLYKNGRRARARRMIKKARNYFQEVFDPCHQAFQAIDESLKHL